MHLRPYSEKLYVTTWWPIEQVPAMMKTGQRVEPAVAKAYSSSLLWLYQRVMTHHSSLGQQKFVTCREFII